MSVLMSVANVQGAGIVNVLCVFSFGEILMIFLRRSQNKKWRCLSEEMELPCTFFALFLFTIFLFLLHSFIDERLYLIKRYHHHREHNFLGITRFF